MPANPILLCVRSAQLRDELERTLAPAGYAITTVGTPAEAVAHLRSSRVDLVVAEGLAVSGAIASLRDAQDGGPTPLLVISPAHDVEARIAFLEAGADDVLAAGFMHHELESRALALLIRTGRVAGEGTREGAGRIVTFFSPKGGVGTTTLAVNTALLLAGAGDPASNGSSPGLRVLVIDLDLQFGQVATHLNLSPRFDIGGLATDEPALNDPDLLRSYLTPHSGGISVLAAPLTPDAELRVTLDALQRIIEVVRPGFDQIVVDLGGRFDERTLWLLEQADCHVFVLFPEISALRAMSLFLAFLSQTAPLRADEHIVINHVFPKELLKSSDVTRLLRKEPTAEVPYAELDMIRAANEGVPVVLGRPRSSAIPSLRRIAQAVVGVDVATLATPAAKKGRGLFRIR